MKKKKEAKIKKRAPFQTPHKRRLQDENMCFSWGQSKFQAYIGSHLFWANTALREQLQDIGVTLFKFYE
jgi:hypothetical protein